MSEIASVIREIVSRNQETAGEFERTEGLCRRLLATYGHLLIGAIVWIEKLASLDPSLVEDVFGLKHGVAPEVLELAQICIKEKAERGTRDRRFVPITLYRDPPAERHHLPILPQYLLISILPTDVFGSSTSFGVASDKLGLLRRMKIVLEAAIKPVGRPKSWGTRSEPQSLEGTLLLRYGGRGASCVAFGSAETGVRPVILGLLDRLGKELFTRTGEEIAVGGSELLRAMYGKNAPRSTREVTKWMKGRLAPVVTRTNQALAKLGVISQARDRTWITSNPTMRAITWRVPKSVIVISPSE